MLPSRFSRLLCAVLALGAPAICALPGRADIMVPLDLVTDGNFILSGGAPVYAAVIYYT